MRRPVSVSRRGLVDAAVITLSGVLAFAVYVRSLAPGLLWGDSAEFQIAAWLGGVSHPTGYPLYLILGWLWSHVMPLGDPAFRMNLFSALWGGVAIALLCLLVMRILRLLVSASSDIAIRLIAFGAALVLTSTPTFWSQAVVAEVYTLNAVFVAGILLVVLAWASHLHAGEVAAAVRSLQGVALLLGLSLAHHRSTILLIPALLLFAWVVLRSSASRMRLTRKQAASSLACLLAPLLLYAYIPLVASQAPYTRLDLAPGWSLSLYDATPAGFLAHISGSVFGSALTAPAGADGIWTRLLARFGDELSVNGLLLGVVGLIWLAVQGLVHSDRRALPVLVLTVSVFVAQLAFNVFYAIGDIHVFYIPAYLVWVLWMSAGAGALALGIGWMAGAVGERVRRPAMVAGGIFAAVALVALAYRAAVVNWPQVQRATDVSARTAWEPVLDQPLPPNAVLVSNDRDEMVPQWYLKYVEGRRPDVTGLFPLIQPGPEWSDVGQVTARALETGRPVYLVKPMPGLDVRFRLALPHGSTGSGLVQVLGPSAMAPAEQTVDVTFGDKLRLVGYDVQPAAAPPDGDLVVVLHWQPLASLDRDYTSFVHVLGSDGAGVGQSDHRAGGEYYPTRLWRTGDILLDAHLITLSSTAAPPYTFEVGLYMIEGGRLQHLGEPHRLP